MPCERNLQLGASTVTSLAPGERLRPGALNEPNVAPLAADERPNLPV